MNTPAQFDRVSFRCSQAVTSQYSTSFSSAIRLLHPHLREPIHGIYGFVRLADEIVDTFHAFDKTQLLDKLEAETYQAISERISLNPILQSFQLTVNRYNIDVQLIAAFFRSMRADLHRQSWDTEQLFREYIYGSAEVVGLMCLSVFCEGNEMLAKSLTKEAASLGAAFQKVNFLRDLKEDTEGLGRQYFPHLRHNRLDPATKSAIEQDILKDFQEAYSGIVRLPEKARLGVIIAYRYYRCLFEKIRSLPPELLLKKRVRVPNLKKMLLLLEATAKNAFSFT